MPKSFCKKRFREKSLWFSYKFRESEKGERSVRGGWRSAEHNSNTTIEMAEDDQDPSLLKSLKERIQSAYDTKELSDCVFSVGEKEVTVKAHKFVMSLSSPVFKAMFHSDLAETGATPIRVTDIEPAAFVGMLQFMYTDSVDFVSPKHAAQVLLAARKYIVPHLITVCHEHIKDTLEPSAVFELREFAAHHNMEDVLEECMAYLKRSTSIVINDEKFKDVDSSFVQSIVQQDELNIESELELFKAVEQWAVRESENREITLDDLVRDLKDVICSFRFETMSLEELKHGILKSSLLSKEEKAALYMNRVDCSVFPYPDEFSSCTDVRRGPVKEWSLKRSWKNRVLVAINDKYNPFPRKSFTVSRPIKLKGLQLEERWELDVKIITDDLTIIEVLKTPGYKVDFHEPHCLLPGKVYWIEITYDFERFGSGYYYDDESTTYKTNNVTIKTSNDYSLIQEMFFEEL